MWSFMESTKPTVFTGSNLEGVERVVKEKGKYANLKNVFLTTFSFDLHKLNYLQ